jgi:sortase A
MSTFRIEGPSSFGLKGRIRSMDAANDPVTTPRRHRWWAGALALALFALGAWQLASAGWIHARAVVAQKLIAYSWDRARENGLAPRPWPSADTRAIARLTVPSHHVDLYVLEGASGRSLAFGPGHVSGTAPPGSRGNSVIVAHRDTHFAFLRSLAPGEEIVVEDPRGAVARYRVTEVSIVDKGETRVLDPADAAQLTLITCFPFDAVLPGTPLRYVVIAERVVSLPG